MATQLCERKMRDDKFMQGETCKMEKDHRGRCSCVTFYCEGCGKIRRGRPAGQSVVRLGDGSIDDSFDFCFLCVRGII